MTARSQGQHPHHTHSLPTPVTFSLNLFVFYFLAAPHGLWDLSSLTGDQTKSPALAALTTGLPGSLSQSLDRPLCLFSHSLSSGSLPLSLPLAPKTQTVQS